MKTVEPLMSATRALMLTLILFTSSLALGFSINDHKAIHDRAVHDLTVCGLLPADWKADDSNTVRDANIDEDVNFVRKMDYSHYYNPYHKIKMDRFDSSVTFVETQNEFAKNLNRQEKLMLAGRITHHLQDSAVPMHVIPVAHDPMDGFEKLKTPDWDQYDPTPQYCTMVRQGLPAELMNFLNASALTTYDSVRDNFDLSMAGTKARSTWLGSFWLDGSSGDFGTYGFLGNTFGTSKTSIGTATVEVGAHIFQTFKSDRMVQAKYFTERALLWVLDRIK